MTRTGAGQPGHRSLHLGLGCPSRHTAGEPSREFPPGACRQGDPRIIAVHAKLENRIPSSTKPVTAQGAAHQTLDSVQAVNPLVGQGIAVGIPSKRPAPGTSTAVTSGNSRCGGSTRTRPPSLNVADLTLARHDVARVPCEFVVPRIVVAFGGDQPSSVTLKPGQGTPFSTESVDDLHGAQVVDARIQSQLVENGNLLLGRCIQGCNLRRDSSG